jgi:hypothetical protein
VLCRRLLASHIKSPLLISSKIEYAVKIFYIWSWNRQQNDLIHEDDDDKNQDYENCFKSKCKFHVCQGIHSCPRPFLTFTVRGLIKPFEKTLKAFET